MDQLHDAQRPRTKTLVAPARAFNPDAGPNIKNIHVNTRDEGG